MARSPFSRVLAGLQARGREALVRTPRDSAPPPRPPGPLIWAHGTGAHDAAALAALAREIAAEAPITLLVTGQGEVAEAAGEARLMCQPAPGYGRSATRSFLDHWRPDAALFLGARPSPAQLSATAATCATTLVGLPLDQLIHLDRASRAALRQAAGVWVLNDAAARAARAAGVAPERLRVTAPLRAAPEAPPCIESDRAELAESLAARPVWLAARPLADELPAVLAAHRAVLASAHRALLVLLPGPGCPDDARLAESLAAEGFSVATRALGEEPRLQTEIYLADRLSPEEDGLWFRLAPLCFLGGTLSGTGPAQSYAAAAALGSAIACGPHGGDHAPGLARLTAAGAVRALGGECTLSDAIEELLSPDRAAELAHAAWVEMSEGAEVIVRLSAHLTAQLDARGVI